MRMMHCSSSRGKWTCQWIHVCRLNFNSREYGLSHTPSHQIRILDDTTKFAVKPTVSFVETQGCYTKSDPVSSTCSFSFRDDDIRSFFSWAAIITQGYRGSKHKAFLFSSSQSMPHYLTIVIILLTIPPGVSILQRYIPDVHLPETGCIENGMRYSPAAKGSSTSTATVLPNKS